MQSHIRLTWPQTMALGGLLLLGACRAPESRSDLGCAPRVEFQGLDRSVLCAEQISTAQTSLGDISVQASLYLPASAESPRFAVVIPEGGALGHVAFATGFWRSMCNRIGCGLIRVLINEPDGLPPDAQATRNADQGSGQLLIDALDSLAVQTRVASLSQVPLLFWSFSAGGSFGVTFGAWRPDRTLGFIRYHSHLRGIQLDTVALSGIPGLLIAADGDETAGVNDSEEFWNRGRILGAPWAFAVQEGPHYSLGSWDQANELTWRWIEGVVAARLQEGGTAEGRIGALREDSGWRASKGVTTGPGTSLNERLGSSWLPDSLTADAWGRLSIR